MHGLRAGSIWAMALVLLLLAGCASRPPAPGYDPAVPRVEVIRVGGPNKPYEVLGRRYVPMTSDAPYRERGGASWYGREFHGKPTALGETFDMNVVSAAHPTLPLPSWARVRHLASGREIVVRINDRGPFKPGRIIDLSHAAAAKLGVLHGVTEVEVERLTHDAIRKGRW